MSTTQNQEPLDEAVEALRCTLRQGRRILVVLGAGASANTVPDMAKIFDKLKTLVQGQVTAGSESEKRLSEIAGWLGSLSQRLAPRSVAAMALGAMQRAHMQLTANPEDLNTILDNVWSEFGTWFADQAIGKDPTDFHQLVAEWVVSGHADAVSLNFDGLTFKAIDAKAKASGGRGAVLSQPEGIDNFFLGDKSAPVLNIFPVVKIWGDVFHAVCVTPQCPERGRRLPVYKLPTSSNAPLECTTCGKARQLQIYFAGFKEKELSAHDSIRALRRFVAPRIGCILTVGFSGLWDKALLKFLCDLAADLEAERAWPAKLGGAGSPLAPCRWINVDKEISPPLLQEAAAEGLSPLSLTMTADEFVNKDSIKDLLTTAGSSWQGTEPFTGDGTLSEGQWEDAIRKLHPCPEPYRLLVTQSKYLKDLELLCQLGIKTRAAVQFSGKPPANERDHNRRAHSFGACHVAALWARKMLQGQNITDSEGERLATVAMFAAAHHDLAHLPFSHLAEEMLSEVHWTLSDWSGQFHHDEFVLGNCQETFLDQVRQAVKGTLPAAANQKDIVEFLSWVECAIEARSGYNWLDAIVNSPLDADKIDYVFRDCKFLGQGIHVPTDEDGIRKWLEELTSHTRVLPSGLVALEGIAGEHARDFLEERHWLYKHQYHQTAFRALERLAATVTLRWLLDAVPKEIADSQGKEAGNYEHVVLDSAAIKGRTAKDRLWKQLTNASAENYSQETGMLTNICDELIKSNNGPGLPQHKKVTEFVRACQKIFKQALAPDSSQTSEPPDRNSGLDAPDAGSTAPALAESPQPDRNSGLDAYLKTLGVTASDVLYLAAADLPEAREIARRLERTQPFRAVFDFSVAPRMLSYPARRRHGSGASEIISECFVVADKDPARWGRPTGKWVPLSESAFAERDKKRWARVFAVSPNQTDPVVTEMLDLFRSHCAAKQILLKDTDPELSAL